MASSPRRARSPTTDIKAICCFTQSGTTGALVARERPTVPIIVMTPLVDVARRMSLTWGTNCVVTEEFSRFKLAVIAAARAARSTGFATSADQIVVTALAAWVDKRFPVVALAVLAVAAGVFVYAYAQIPDPNGWREVPDAFISVAARLLN